MLKNNRLNDEIIDLVQDPAITHEQDSSKRLISEHTSSILAKSRILFLEDSFNGTSCGVLIKLLLVLDAQAETKGLKGGDSDISLYVNSPGGEITMGFALMATIRNLKYSKVNVIIIGQACSMGAYLLTCTTGKRYATPLSRVMYHRASGGASGNVQDTRIRFEEMEKMDRKLAEEITMCSNFKTVEDYLKFVTRDAFLSPEEALKHGLIDEILKPVWFYDIKKKTWVNK
mgnify:CR=1 FL=1